MVAIWVTSWNHVQSFAPSSVLSLYYTLLLCVSVLRLQAGTTEDNDITKDATIQLANWIILACSVLLLAFEQIPRHEIGGYTTLFEV
jgi:hypothetical protein